MATDATLPTAATMPADTPIWLTTDEAALRARCGEKIIYRAARSGKLRCAKVGGRRELRFRPLWIDQWLESLVPQEDVQPTREERMSRIRARIQGEQS